MCLRSLLGLDSAVSEYLSTLSISDLVKLVYRDHIPLKHSNRNRLALEIDELGVADKQSGQQQQHQHDLNRPALPANSNPTPEEVHLMSKLLVRYLMEVLLQQYLICFQRWNQ